MVLAGFVLWTVFAKDADVFLLVISLLAALLISFIVLVDYHWSTVIRFYAKHPSKRKVKINWLDSDSEPDFAYEREGAQPVEDMKLPEEKKEND